MGDKIYGRNILTNTQIQECQLNLWERQRIRAGVHWHTTIQSIVTIIFGMKFTLGQFKIGIVYCSSYVIGEKKKSPRLKAQWDSMLGPHVPFIKGGRDLSRRERGKIPYIESSEGLHARPHVPFIKAGRDLSRKSAASSSDTCESVIPIQMGWDACGFLSPISRLLGAHFDMIFFGMQPFSHPF